MDWPTIITSILGSSAVTTALIKIFDTYVTPKRDKENRLFEARKQAYTELLCTLEIFLETGKAISIATSFYKARLISGVKVQDQLEELWICYAELEENIKEQNRDKIHRSSQIMLSHLEETIAKMRLELGLENDQQKLLRHINKRINIDNLSNSHSVTAKEEPFVESKGEGSA